MAAAAVACFSGEMSFGGDDERIQYMIHKECSPAGG